MPRNIFAGGGVNAFMGDNNPLYVQNMNSLKAAFTDLQNGTTATGPIGSVIMWTGTTSNIPAGYAVANGAYLNTVTYATLYNIIGIRYGALVGATFPLPNFTSNVPEGITGVPTVPSTKTTSIASAVDVHTHTVNGTINTSGAPNAGLALALVTGNADAHTHVGGLLTQGTANTHTHSGATLNLSNLNAHTHAGGTLSGANSNIGNTQAHSHPIAVNTGDESAFHAHTTSGQSANHTHIYFRPNTGANNNTGTPSVDHSHTVNSNTTNHTHGILANSSNANATGINGSNSNIGNFTYSSPPNLPPYFPGGADISMSTNAVGAPNASLGMSVSAISSPSVAANIQTSTALGLGINAGNANTHTHAAANLTAATATTITASTPAHTHTTATTQIIFIIRVS